MEALHLSHSVGNSLWKRLWTCRKTDCGMNEQPEGQLTH